MDRAVIRRIVGFAFVLLLVAGMRLLFEFSNRIPGAYDVTVELGRAGSGMSKGTDVKVRGVRVGGVTDVAFEDSRAVVTVRLRPDPPIPADVTPVVTAKTLLGEKQIELRHDGSLDEPPFLKAGDVIRVADGDYPTEVEAVLANLSDTLEKIDPERLATLVDAFGSFDESDARTVRRNLEMGVTLAEWGARTADDQLARLSAFADVVEGLAPVAGDLNRIAETMPAWVSLLPERQEQFRATADALRSWSVGFAELLETERPVIRALLTTGDRIGATIDPRVDEIGRMIYGIYRYSLVFGQHGGSLTDGSEHAWFRAFLGDEGTMGEICASLPPEFEEAAPGCVNYQRPEGGS